MRSLFRHVAVLLALFSGPAAAQQFPTVPSGTVIGRSQLGAGPAQAIPFSQLIALMLQSQPLSIPSIATNSVVFKGSISGQATVQAQAAAGTPSLNLPTTSGTIPSSATTPIIIDPVTGVVSCPTCSTSTGAASPIISSRSVAQTLNLSTFAGITTIGYAAAGDGGGATFKNVGTTALTDTGGSFTDAVGNNFQLVWPASGLNWAAFGVFCDGTTDVRANLQNAISGTPEGAMLRGLKQAGACLTGKNPSAAYALTASRPIHISCDSGVAIQPTSALGTTSSVLYLFGNPDGVNIQTIIEGCFIGNPGAATRYGLYGIVFDTQTAGNYFRAPIVKNVFIQAGTSGNGYGILALNNVTNNPNGGIYAADFGDGSIIQGGIDLVGSGDSITIRGILPQNGAVGADNNGLLVNLATGAGSLTLSRLNFSQSAGVNIQLAYSLFIDGGEYELQAPLTGTAVVNISASGGTVLGAKIRNAQFQAVSGIGTPLLLNIAANVGTIVVDGNAFATPTSYTGVANASTDLRLGPNYWLTGPTHVSGTAPSIVYGGG